ncbi:MAG: hypothetical protein JO036_11900 [Candidatus Eremiobacteraeota bacterium]|nr:hypothetical protein [Candidatus Eremiobacteraeota bacterium]
MDLDRIRAACEITQSHVRTMAAARAAVARKAAGTATTHQVAVQISTHPERAVRRPFARVAAAVCFGVLAVALVR